jgi:signal transduction histidine kinase
LDDARFGEPLSGLYWQIEEDQTGTIVGSRSLWDSRILVPKHPLAKGAVDILVLPGPQDKLVRVAERMIVFDQASGSRALRMAVAMDTAEIVASRQAFAADLWPSLGVVGLLLLLATWIYIGIGLKPLDAIRHRLNAVRTGAAPRLEGAFPAEVTPLVDEVNALLAVQEEALARARARASDLAHGLQTPLAVLRSDAERLRDLGQGELAQEISDLTEQMRQHVQRELARTRLRGADLAQATTLAPLIERVVASLRRMPMGEALAWESAVTADLRVAVDPQDLTELLGNLLENAAKWARGAVRVEAHADGARAIIRVLDDGPGVPDLALAQIVDRGVRLDQNVPGTGLGLAIARDIASACQGSLQLSNRPEGGFCAAVTLPIQTRSTHDA